MHEQYPSDVSYDQASWVPEHILDQISDAVFVMNRGGEIVYLSKMAEQLTGYTREEALHHRGCYELLEHFDAEGRSLCKNDCSLLCSGLSGQAYQAAVCLRHKAGHLVPVIAKVTPYRTPEGHIQGTIHTFCQDTRLAEAERRIAELEAVALVDPLTRLFNRRGFEHLLELSLDDFRRYKRAFSVLFVDLDHFKRVNDNFGHNVGDEILVAVARALKNSLRKSDTIGRWGGEEFVVLFQGSRFGAACVAERCRMLVAATSVSGDVSVTASIGVTTVRPGDTAEELIARADRLLYESKSNGRDRVTSDSLPSPLPAEQPAANESAPPPST